MTAALLTFLPIGNVLLDRCPMSARFGDGDAMIKRWRARPETPQIVFIGSSRTGCSLNVETIAPRVRKISGDHSVQIFNAAVVAAEPLTMRFLSARMMAEGRTPKLAILEITPDTVARRNITLDYTLTRQFVFRDIRENLADIFHSTNKTISRVFSSRLIPFYTHRLALRSWAAESWTRLIGEPVTEEIEEPRHDFFSEWARAQKLVDPPLAARVQRDVPRIRQQLRDYETAGKTPAALEELVARCQRSGIKVMLLEPPMHSALRALFVPAIRTPYRAFVEHLERTHGCRFVDLSDRVPDTMFVDSFHVAPEGREYFSRLFAEEILGPVWRAETHLPPE
jgi:hypothetical protein